MKRIVFSKEDIDFIIEQYQSHKMTAQELGDYFHCSRDTIARRLKENNIVLKQVYKHEDLTNKKFGLLTVIKENKERYETDKKRTNKPHRYWYCKCDCGNSELIQVESSHLKNGHTISCGCIKSLGEQKITKILMENDIPFKSEYSFKDLRGVNGGILRYDFAILNDNGELAYLVEYHGEQHYRQNGGWNNEKEFQNRQANDKLKEEYALNHNIPLLIIPYTVKPQNINIKHLTIKGE